MSTVRFALARFLAVFAVIALTVYEPPPAANAQASGTFPDQPFNGLQITYSVSGATVTGTKDTPGFTTSRALSGKLGTGQLTVTGTAAHQSAVQGYGADVTVRVWAGNQSKDFKADLTPPAGQRGGSRQFSLAVPIPADAAGGGFSISMTGYYNVGTRGLVVSGEFTGSPVTATPTRTPTPVPATATRVPPSATPASPATATPVPPTATPTRAAGTPTPTATTTATATPAADLDVDVIWEVTRFLQQFDQTCFGQVISLGDATTYQNALWGVNVEVNPALNAYAQYTPEIWYRAGRLELSWDPRTGTPSQEQRRTMWHEITHRIEDMNGDIGYSNSTAYAERNTEYIERVQTELQTLQRIEDNARAGRATAPMIEQYRRTMERLYGMRTSNPGTEAPDVDQLERWTGFRAHAGDIEDLYLSGACGDALRDLARAASAGSQPSQPAQPSQPSPAGPPPIQFEPPDSTGFPEDLSEPEPDTSGGTIVLPGKSD